MSLFSKYTFYCNNCGKELKIEWMKMLGRTFKVCSKECIDAIELKIARSILGEENKNNEEIR